MRLSNNIISGLLLVAAIPVVFSSCDEDSNIGASLVETESSVIIADDFVVNGYSTPIGAVQSRSIIQLIGDIDAKGFGKFKSDFITQFMPASALDTNLLDKSQIDGLRLVMMHNAGQFVGDSIVPMGLEIYRLDKNLVAPIYSNINPDEYYSPDKLLASKAYTAANSELSDSLAKLSYREIIVDLPKSLGIELFEMYQSDPALYNNPVSFNDKFKGLYVRSSFGSGRVTKIGATVMQLLYHVDTKNAAGRDTTINYKGNFYAVSPEIITNNNISYEMSDQLSQRISAGEKLIVAPAGQEIVITFPIVDVISYYKAHAAKVSVLNDLTFSVPTSQIANDYNINPPQYLLMVLESKKKEFFENSSVNDNRTSFYAQYNTTTGEYDFGSLRGYLQDMMAKKDITAEDYTFTLTPVSVTTETVGSSYYGTQKTYVTSIAPYIEQPAMVKINLDSSKIILTFSNQSLKN